MGNFRTRRDGDVFPIHRTSASSAISLQTFKTLQKQDKKRTRLTTRQERARLATLENPLLWSNFLKKFQRLNPEFDFEGNTNKSLEPEESIMDLKRKFPELDIGLKSEHGAEFREFLDEFGIDNIHMQNMVAMQEPPLTEEELATFSYVVNNRPEWNLKIDKSLKAPKTMDLRKYSKQPNRLDLKGFKF